jgi:hypothetical protein
LVNECFIEKMQTKWVICDMCFVILSKGMHNFVSDISIQLRFEIVKTGHSNIYSKSLCCSTVYDKVAKLLGDFAISPL